MALLDKINYLTLPNKISVQTSSQSAAGVQNWKDGSSDGSVRTLGSSVQGNDYKIGKNAVAEGSNTQAIGQNSHAEGLQTIAKGSNSHAEGYKTTAEGIGSHVEGLGTQSTHAYQHIFGTYNKKDISSNSSNQKGTYVEIVGNGTSNNLTNARTLDWQGNEVLSGKLTVGIAGTNPMDVATVSQLSDTKVTQNDKTGTNAAYRVLLSTSATNTSETSTINKTSSLLYNPSQVSLYVGDPANEHITIGKTGITFDTGSGYTFFGKTQVDVWNTAATWVTNNKTAALTDNKVAQNNSTSANDYRVLLSNTASDSNATATANKSAGLRFMPSTNHLYVGNASQEALITVSPRMHLGAFNRYTLDGQTESSTSYGIGLGISNGLAYNSYLTTNSLLFQHWNASRPSGGVPSSTNYVNSSCSVTNQHIVFTDYSEKGLIDKSITVNNSGMTIQNTKGNITRYFTSSAHSIVASQFCTRISPVNPEGLTITAYQNGGVVSFNIAFQVTTAVTNATALFEFTPKYYPANALQCVIVKYANKRYTRPETLGAYVSTNNVIMANNLQANTSYRVSGTYMLK